MEIEKLSWSDVEIGIEKLAKQFPGQDTWGIPRGGSVVAALLSFHGCVLAQSLFLADILVDDIVCTGETVKVFREANLHKKFATLVIRESSNFKPDYCGLRLDTPHYIQFPWEDDAVTQALVASGRFTDQDVDTRLSKRKLNVQSQTQLIDGHKLNGN